VTQTGGASEGLESGVRCL